MAGKNEGLDANNAIDVLRKAIDQIDILRKAADQFDQFVKGLPGPIEVSVGGDAKLVLPERQALPQEVVAYSGSGADASLRLKAWPLARTVHGIKMVCIHAEWEYKGRARFIVLLKGLRTGCHIMDLTSESLAFFRSPDLPRDEVYTLTVRAISDNAEFLDDVSVTLTVVDGGHD